MASFKIRPDRLNKEELQYEIKLRGAIPEGNSKDLVQKLRQLLRLEKGGHSFTWSANFKSNEEIIICKTKLTDIKQTLSENFSTSLVRKLQCKLAQQS